MPSCYRGLAPNVNRQAQHAVARSIERMKSAARVGLTVLVVAILGVLVLALVAGAGFVVIRRVGVDRAIEDAKQLTVLSARVVEQRVTDGVVTGDAEATGNVARVINDAVLHDPIEHVKLWGPDGTILYSDELKAIGQRFASGEQELAELADGEVSAEISDLSAPENRYEQGSGPLLEVYTPLQTPDGTRLLFETYQRYSSIDEQRQQLFRDFAPVLVVALLALAAALIPLGWILARRLQRSGREREEALQRSLDMADRERRRIAGDLHDGPVQELAGLSMRLSAAAEGTDDPNQRAVLRESAGAVRGSVRTLRSAIVGVYPPNLEAAGLGPALEDLTSRLPREGLEVSLDVEDAAGYGPVANQLLYRVCQESLRNVEKHAGASHVLVRVRRVGSTATLEVTDDGRGIDAESAAEDHLGLRIVEDLVSDAGGTLRVEVPPGGGTVVRVEVPTP
jgi:signal transduction histidine kinase